MLKFIAHQDPLPNASGTFQAMKDNLPAMANNAAAGQIAERLQDKYGSISCVVHPDTKVEVIVKLELRYGGDSKSLIYTTSNNCCKAFGPILNEQLENMSLED